MKQTAQTLTEDQYLQISDNQNISVAKDHAEISEKNAILPFIQTGLFSEVTPLYYRTRVRLAFTLAAGFQSRFVMIKGLIEFYRTKQFSFQFDFKKRTIETDVDVIQLTELQLFLNNVALWLNQELQFKDALKIVLKFENHYKLERAAVYSLLKHTAAQSQVSH